MKGAAAETVSAKSTLIKLTRKRLEKYATLLPKLMVSDDPETLHDLRVWGRRLQQAVRVISGKPKSKQLKKLVANIRRVRRTLGPCRDLDVNIAIVKAQREANGNGSVNKAWALIQHEFETRRPDLIERARGELAGQELFKFISRTQRLTSAAERDFDPVEEISRAMTKSMDKWKESLTATGEQPNPAALHALRIAGKKVRYSAELLADLGQGKVNPLVKSLKEIQSLLGDWHDRAVLQNHIEKFIRRAGFLTDHPDSGRILLAELEKERLRDHSEVTNVRQKAAKVQQAWANWKAGAAADS
jgi:CHAD domain-containing protein